MTEREIPTVTVLKSRPVMRADGRVAIELVTQEKGAIAFEVDLQSIAILQKALAKLEAVLRNQGNA